ncbi:MAG: translation elongation factor Ts [Armatimonas sp.]
MTAAMVGQLRERTGLGMMECKKALTETDGDLEAAVELLRAKGVKDRGDRVAGEGLILAYIADGGKEGALIELNSETDFVARNDDFKALGRLLAEKAATSSAATPDEVLADPGLKAYYEEAVRKIGEKVVFSRLQKFVAGEGAQLVSYVHNTSGPQTDGGKIGVLVEIVGDAELGREIAQHISFARPKALSEAEVSPELLAKETAIIHEQTANDPKLQGKPEAAINSAVQGRVRKFLGEIVLLNQAYVRDDKKTVSQLLSEGKSSINRYAVFQVGENAPKGDA